MVYVRLAQGWTDGGGAAHAPGDMVDVDAVTLAELEEDGVVATTDKVDGERVRGGVRAAAWPGLTTPRPDGSDDGSHDDAWPGLTTPSPDSDSGGGSQPAPGSDGKDGDEEEAWPGLT
jgi:hypothetical protein